MKKRRLRPGILDVFITVGYQTSYRNLRRMLYSGGHERWGDNPPSDAALRALLSKLKREGLLVRSDKIWKITRAGREYLDRIMARERRKEYSHGPKNLIVMFDIPEQYRRERDLLRAGLRDLGFEMIQKSVWLGPGALPQEFLESLDKQKVIPFLKFFKAKPEEIM